MQLRIEVFVVEQNCVFQDADNKDAACMHLMATVSNKLVAYSRIVPPGISYNEPSIGRVVTSPEVRATGCGKDLMKRSIDAVELYFGQQSIRIGAQLYLKHFYESFGFLQSSDVYDEDGIDHIEMLRTIK